MENTDYEKMSKQFLIDCPQKHFDEHGQCKYCGWMCEFPESHAEHDPSCKYINKLFNISIDEDGELCCKLKKKKKKCKAILETEDTKNHSAYKKFRNALIRHSVKCKTYEKCHKQWQYSNFASFEEDTEQHKCICGVAITKAHILKNIKTGETVNIGFVCYPHWICDVTRADELKNVETIRKVCVNKWNKFTKLFYSYYVGDITEWDCSFYKDIKDKRIESREKGQSYTLSRKQKHHIKRVEEMSNYSTKCMTEINKTKFINYAIQIGF